MALLTTAATDPAHAAVVHHDSVALDVDEVGHRLGHLQLDHPRARTDIRSVTVGDVAQAFYLAVLPKDLDEGVFGHVRRESVNRHMDDVGPDRFEWDLDVTEQQVSLCYQPLGSGHGVDRCHKPCTTMVLKVLKAGVADHVLERVHDGVHRRVHRHVDDEALRLGRRR